MPELVIEVLYVEHCPSVQGALSLVQRVCTELGIGAEVDTARLCRSVVMSGSSEADSQGGQGSVSEE